MFHFTNSRRIPILLSCLALTTCSCAARNPPIPPAPPDSAVVAANPGVKRLAAADTDFGFRLLHQLTHKDPAGNVFFSPFSVSQALLLTLNGAGGRTKQDMAQTLGLGTMPLDQVNAANALLRPSLTHPDPKVIVSVANALWANQGVMLDPAFQQRCRRYSSAQATTLDFGSPSASDTINGWVSQNTQGKITQIVSQDALAQASVVLTNAVYFHGKWQSPFDKSNTQTGPFTLSAGHTKSVPLMSQQSNFSYLETPQFQAVSLPYGAGRMSMYVFLPKSGSSLNGLTELMNSQKASRWIAAMVPTDMTIILPRFKADYKVTLNDPLIALGLGSAFGETADFGLMGRQKFRVSAVLHKAVLEVDEEGTVAAAATAVAMPTAAARPAEVTVMRVDHPFFCAIRDDLTGAILFEGEIRDPQ